MAKQWDVYAFDRPTRTATWIGTVEGEHEPAARNVASRRWPENAKIDLPLYPSGRLILRPAGETWGMPCKIVRCTCPPDATWSTSCERCKGYP